MTSLSSDDSRKRAILITGVSTGIGLATVHSLLKKGYKVYGSVRKQADAERIVAEVQLLGYGGNFVPLLFDVTDNHAVSRAAEQVAKDLQGSTLFCLINNAGMNCGPDPVEMIPMEKLRYQFEVNVMGPVAVTQAFLPLLGTDVSRHGPPGRVIFVGSIYGSYGIPWQGAYCATKHALEGLTESLRQELKVFGISVTLVRPGPTASEIWNKSTSENRSREKGTGDWEVYDSSLYGPSMANTRRFILEDMAKKDFYLPCSEIAQAVCKVVESAEPMSHVMKTTRLLENWILPRWVPTKARDNVIAEKCGIKRWKVSQDKAVPEFEHAVGTREDGKAEVVSIASEKKGL